MTDRTLSILLIEDEPAECQLIADYIDTTDDVTLIGSTGDTTKALKYIKDCLPDAVILDLELHKGGGNGLSFLQNLTELDLRYKPYILVTTNNTSTITHEQARILGADFIMTKAQSDYSAENVIEFLRSIKGVLHRRAEMQAQSIESMTTESPDQLRKRIIKRIASEIDQVNISPKALGRGYLVDAICQTALGSGKNIYATIANEHKKSSASVERAMQTAIDRAWKTSGIDELQKYYTAHISSAKGVPTVTEFIYYYANKIKNEY